MTREQIEAQRRALEELPHTQAKEIALELLAHIAALEQDLLDMAQSHEETVKERDDANARLEMEIQQTKAAADALSEAAAELSTLRREHAAAVADNAAFLKEVATVHQWAVKAHQHSLAEAMAGVMIDGGHPGAALLEEHRKALVSARNEGREEVAAVASADAERARRAIAKLNLTTDMGQRRHILLAQRRDLMDALVRDIRAMKDPE